MNLEEPHGTGINAIERYGLGLLRRYSGSHRPRVHRWSADELRAIHRQQTGALLWAAVAGAVSGALIGGAEIGFRGPLFDENAAWHEQLPYWGTYLAVAVVVSIVEVLFLYLMMLRRVARIGAIAGLGLSSGDIGQVLAVGMSRAALEMPNPRSPVYGIDPYARVPRWKLLAYTVLYRLKVGATSFILRILLRRVLARAAVRTFIPLIAVPVFAVWNALVTAWVMREAQIRAAGPLVVQQLGEWLDRQQPALDADGQRLVLQVVGESIMRAHDAHPNFVLLLTRLFERFEIEPDQVRVEWSQVRERLAGLPADRRRPVLVVALATVLLNGRVRRSQLALVEELNRTCGAAFDRPTLLGYRRRMLHGEGLPLDEIAERCEAVADRG
jgi:hypothetical protein